MTEAWLVRLANLLAGEPADAVDSLNRLIAEGLDQLPRPGGGETLNRWRALAAVGEFDLSLAKLYEGHTDALSILAELGDSHEGQAVGSWCVWAAEAPGGRTVYERQADGAVRLYGAKHWCSGASGSDHALLTAWDARGTGPQLVRLGLDQDAVHVDKSAWKAVGMVGSASLKVEFSGALGYCVGATGDYLNRPGFWQGGAGVAACWFGGARGIAQALRRNMLLLKPGPILEAKQVIFGKVELALRETAAVLREAACWIDSNPQETAADKALGVRLLAEQSAKRVLDEVGKALGAAPFCLDAKFARAAADLPVFIRQSHTDRDFGSLGALAMQQEKGWDL